MFAYCTNLESVSFNGKLEEIDRDMFISCPNLKSISLPNTIKTIDISFVNSGHNTLEEINVKDGGIYYSSLDGVLYNGDKTILYKYPIGKKDTTFVIPKTVKEINNSAIFGAKYIENIIIQPDSVEKLGSTCFGGCKNLKIVTIPKCVKEISESLKYNVPYHILNGSNLNTVIKCEKGSYAEKYAMRRDYNYEYIDGNIERVGDVVANLDTGKIGKNEKIALSCNTEGAAIYFIIDDTRDTNIPTNKNTMYTEPIEITKDSTIYAIAVKDGMADSKLYQFSYVISDNYTTVKTNEVISSDITETSAIITGTLNSNEKIREKGFIYYPAKNAELEKKIIVNGENFSAKITGLSADTEYKVYAYANTNPRSIIGNIVSFKTPEIHTDKPTSITLNRNYMSINVNNSSSLITTVLPETAKNRNVLWNSENENIATVDENGKVTAIAEGTTKIWAKTEVENLSAYCNIKVNNTQVNGEFDFSELNMAAYASTTLNEGNGFTFPTTADKGLDGSGNVQMALAYLASWKGAVLENRDKYPTSSNQVKYNEIPEDYHIQEAVLVPQRQEYLYNDEIKTAIMKYGAMYSSFRCNNYYFNNNYKNYYLPPSVDCSDGHAIAIVGWDDNYPKENFRVTPEGNGAFICKNSWGADIGENGYFYISYYDKHIGKSTNAVFNNIETKTNYNKIYQYDPFGYSATLGFYKSAYMSNVFEAEKDELLTAVSFYTFEKNIDYEIYVINDYVDKNSFNNLQSPLKVGTIENSGYHTISFEQIPISSGKKFAVVVKLTNSLGYVNIAIEVPYACWKNARANSGESFYSSNGLIWNDVINKSENTNICLKAFTVDSSNPNVLLAGVDNENKNYENNKTYSLEEAKSLFEINPAFIEYIENKENISLATEENDGFSLGEIPPSVEIINNGYNISKGTILPSRYDLRNENGVTAVKDQGAYGTCWTFATYASLESCILRKSNSMSGDFNSSTDIIGEISGSSNIPVKTIKFLDSEIKLKIGENKQLDVEILPLNTTNQNLIWSSNNENIVKVNSSGNIFAFKDGKTTITATTEDGFVKAICNITVENKLADGSGLYGDASLNWNIEVNDASLVLQKVLNNSFIYFLLKKKVYCCFYKCGKVIT